jgi:hypothetical protein
MTTLRRAAAVAALATLTTLAGCASGDKTATPTATTIEQPAGDAPAETFPDEGITTTTKPDVLTGRVGETVTLTSVDTGQEVMQVKVDRVRFARGDEYNKPERGLFLGVYVKAKALADDQTSQYGSLYVQMRGHHYDADGCCPDGFTPTLAYVDLNTGETSEGWLVFDVPARHGEVVLEQEFGGGKIATWKF